MLFEVKHESRGHIENDVWFDLLDFSGIGEWMLGRVVEPNPTGFRDSDIHDL
jgi:hypothetical protein